MRQVREPTRDRLSLTRQLIGGDLEKPRTPRELVRPSCEEPLSEAALRGGQPAVDEARATLEVRARVHRGRARTLEPRRRFADSLYLLRAHLQLGQARIELCARIEIATPKKTLLEYLGLSTNVGNEKHLNSAGSLLTTKSYAYDAYGGRIGMSDSPAGQPKQHYTFGFDVHGSVSLLLSESGQARASYGYRSYGSTDMVLSRGDASATDPINPYRYTNKRVDTGSGTIDMGARRFAPSSGRFLTPDRFGGSTADLYLSLDPLTQNRYSFAGGNPVGFVEFDGHQFFADGFGAGWIAPPQPVAPPAEAVPVTASTGSSSLLDVVAGAASERTLAAPSGKAPGELRHDAAKVAAYVRVVGSSVATMGPGAFAAMEFEIAPGGKTADIALVSPDGKTVYLWEVKQSRRASLGNKELDRMIDVMRANDIDARRGYPLFASGPVIVQRPVGPISVRDSGRYDGVILYSAIPPRRPVPQPRAPFVPVVPVPKPKPVPAPRPALPLIPLGPGGPFKTM
jgi:RHS repeat-associated protein